MTAKRVVTIVVDEWVRRSLAQALAELAREIKTSDGCTDEEAIERAMKQYDRLVLDVQGSRNRLMEAQASKRREDTLRASGQPTLRTSLGSMAGNLAALRDKLPPGKGGR